MASRLSVADAKKALLNAFPPNVNPVESFNKHAEDFYLQILDAIGASILFGNTHDKLSLTMFLYAGCCRFERWFAPSPYVVPPELHANFARFVQALKMAEGGSTHNTAVFELHVIRNALYDEFDRCPLNKIDMYRLTAYEEQIAKILVPIDSIKRKEYVEQQSEMISLINGLRTRSLRARINTRIPYILHEVPLLLAFTWQGLAVRVNITPEFMQPMGTFVNFSGPVTQAAVSRWQHGISHVGIEITALIDFGKHTDSLQATETHAAPIQGWPQSFSMGFRLISDLAWNLRLRHYGEQHWLPVPTDLGDMESYVVTADRDRIGWKLQGSPSAIFKTFAKSDQLTEIDLGRLENPEWSVKCRSIATQYLALGETNEALFWINVAVEALCNERFGEIGRQIGRPELEGEITSPKAFWTPADEIVRMQFPEMVGKIKWPDTKQHVSLYAKLKYLHKKVKMRTDISEVLKNYSLISSDRNALFHGSGEQRVPISVVSKAMEGFDWIKENLKPDVSKKD